MEENKDETDHLECNKLERVICAAAHTFIWGGILSSLILENQGYHAGKILLSELGAGLLIGGLGATIYSIRITNKRKESLNQYNYSK